MTIPNRSRRNPHFTVFHYYSVSKTELTNWNMITINTCLTGKNLPASICMSCNTFVSAMNLNEENQNTADISCILPKADAILLNSWKETAKKFFPECKITSNAEHIWLSGFSGMGYTIIRTREGFSINTSPFTWALFWLEFI